MIPPEQVAAMVADANLLDDGTDVYLADWVRALAAEVTRLTARVAEVTEQAKRAGDRVDATEADNETLRKRITTLSKERDRLRAALGGLLHAVDEHDAGTAEYDLRVEEARRALDAKGAG